MLCALILYIPNLYPFSASAASTSDSTEQDDNHHKHEMKKVRDVLERARPSSDPHIELARQMRATFR
jgi:hypothetical protein